MQHGQVSRAQVQSREAPPVEEPSQVPRAQPATSLALGPLTSSRRATKKLPAQRSTPCGHGAANRCAALTAGRAARGQHQPLQNSSSSRHLSTSTPCPGLSLLPGSPPLLQPQFLWPFLSPRRVDSFVGFSRADSIHSFTGRGRIGCSPIASISREIAPLASCSSLAARRSNPSLQSQASRTHDGRNRREPVLASAFSPSIRTQSWAAPLRFLPVGLARRCHPPLLASYSRQLQPPPRTEHHALRGTGGPNRRRHRHGCHVVSSNGCNGPDASEQQPWGGGANAIQDKTGSAARLEQTHRSPFGSQNGNVLSSSYQPSNNHHGFDLPARKMHSVDNLSGARWDKPAEDRVLSPPLAIEPKTGRAGSSDWLMHGQQNSMGDERKRPIHQTLGFEDDSKWIHRDKLAKIESEELQAAGLFVPRTRAPSKQRRERSQSRLTRGGDSTDMGSSRPTDVGNARLRKDSATLEQLAVPAAEPTMVAAEPTMAAAEPTMAAAEPTTPLWDLRTPEEIAEEEANAYFASNGAKGGSRIPVAKTSPAPIPVDYLERGAPAARKQNENPEGDMISYPKPRSRSASLSVSDQASTGTGPKPAAKRSVTDTSPKKNTPRKTSTASRNSASTGRPKTRSGPIKDSPSTRPSTRAGEPFAASKQPEGDPPWMLNSYKPDPRLPPDQQLLPTVARRLQQEKWEKEGKFGDVYDKEFRPLNDHEFLKPPEPEPDPEPEKTNPVEEENQPQPDEWPLKPGVAKSPTLRQGSYSTMPKISDKPPLSPMTSPRTPVTQQPTPAPQIQHKTPATPDRHEDEKKGGCGCCVVM
ncbi:Uncharacterized protein TPAR_01595 [Tolypocladium paradoxum]|uniref:TeaA receptor TeaR n=1 Tax=Tolypocladium paradoxum TaxID=94208 RepID=A0A2S4L724_9HYPO|nr:Uncharacterized protein TPAR_01595 [Tolypocladium paradoxum]